MDYDDIIRTTRAHGTKDVSLPIAELPSFKAWAVWNGFTPPNDHAFSCMGVHITFI